jgi:hypothetical protein
VLNAASAGELLAMCSSVPGCDIRRYLCLRYIAQYTDGTMTPSRYFNAGLSRRVYDCLYGLIIQLHRHGYLTRRRVRVQRKSGRLIFLTTVYEYTITEHGLEWLRTCNEIMEKANAVYTLHPEGRKTNS